MINPAKLEEIAKQITNNMPQGVKNLADTLEGKTRVITNKIAYLVQKCEYKARIYVCILSHKKSS